MKKFSMLKMADINPYDDNHPKTEPEWEEVEKKYPDPSYSWDTHKKGIEYISRGLCCGGEITPIAVRETVIDYFGMNRKYERLDGYKRYMACALRDLNEIPCYIYSGDEATPGCQHGAPAWIKEPDADKLRVSVKEEPKKEKEKPKKQRIYKRRKK